MSAPELKKIVLGRMQATLKPAGFRTSGTAEAAIFDRSAGASTLPSRPIEIGSKKRKMKKYAQIYTLFLMLVFCTSCKGQNKTELPKDDIKSETKDVITSRGPNHITRTIKQDRNGNIWIAVFDGIFRYVFFDTMENRLPILQAK